MLSKSVCLLQMASEHLRLPEGEMTASPVTPLPTIACVRSGTASATRPARVYAATKSAASKGEKELKARVLTEAHGPIEEGEGSVQVTLAEGQQSDPPEGPHEAPGVVNLLGNPEPFIPEGPALGECAELGMAPGQEGTGLHGEQKDLAEALTVTLPTEGHYGLPAAVDRPPIVALGIMRGQASGSPAPAEQHPRRRWRV